jgi:hypothetical protein
MSGLIFFIQTKTKNEKLIFHKSISTYILDKETAGRMEIENAI